MIIMGNGLQVGFHRGREMMPNFVVQGRTLALRERLQLLPLMESIKNMEIEVDQYSSTLEQEF